MKTTTLAALALIAALPTSKAATITLAEYGLNLDGTIYEGAPFPVGVDTSLFDPVTGLGTITCALSPGSHYLSLFVDHEIDQSINTWFNEFGDKTVVPPPAAGQSWEIDEPGWLSGDIFDNFAAGSLDNLIFGGVTSGPDDVSMALGWDLSLTPCQAATVRFTVSETAPAGGVFYLTQSDPDSGAAVYFSSSVTVAGGSCPDGGSTLALLLCACGGLAGLRSARKIFH